MSSKPKACGSACGFRWPRSALRPPDYREHPEWAALDQEGKPKITGTAAGEKGVMCMATAFRDVAAARIIDAIERFRLAYVKLDLTTIFNAYGEAPGCWAKGHDHGNWAESLNLIYEGISYVTAKVYEKHPDVLLDLTFELWGQKHIIDAGLLAAGDLDWMSNVDDRQPDSAGPIQARQLLYQRAASMPVESMLIGNLHAELPTDRGELCHRHRLGAAAARRSAQTQRRRSPVVSRKDRVVQEAAPHHEDQRELLPAGKLAADLPRSVGRLRAPRPAAATA